MAEVRVDDAAPRKVEPPKESSGSSTEPVAPSKAAQKETPRYSRSSVHIERDSEGRVTNEPQDMSNVSAVQQPRGEQAENAIPANTVYRHKETNKLVKVERTLPDGRVVWRANEGENINGNPSGQTMRNQFDRQFEQFNSAK